MTTQYALYDGLTQQPLGRAVYVREEIDDILAGMRFVAPEIRVVINFGVPFKAEIIRDAGEADQVVIHIGSLKREFVRGKAPGQLGASGPSTGKKVLADCVLVDFRPDNDALTDRGFIRVMPDGCAELVIKAKAILAEGVAASSIIKDAEDAIDEAMFNHFVNT
jgi:hypothetical protein